MNILNLDLAASFPGKREDLVKTDIRKRRDSNLDAPYIIDVQDNGFFYHNKEDRDQDYETITAGV